MKSSDAFFKDKANRYCWGDCDNMADGCEGRVKPVLVFSDSSPKMMDCGPEGMPFFYCNEAIQRDENTGFRVEVVEIEGESE